MQCPECGSKTQVTDSRQSQAGTWRRRRECNKCNYRFTTYESALKSALPNTIKHHSSGPAAILQDPAREKFIELTSPVIEFLQFHFPDMFSKDVPFELTDRALGWMNSIRNDE